MITADQALRGGKAINLKEVVDSAVEDCPGVKHVLVARRTGADIRMKHGRDLFLDEVHQLARHK